MGVCTICTQGTLGRTGASETPTGRPTVHSACTTAFDVNVATRTTEGTGRWTKAQVMDVEISMDLWIEEWKGLREIMGQRQVWTFHEGA